MAKGGGTIFYFVTDGVELAFERARTVSEDKKVAVGGGANVAQQVGRAGLIDEMQIHVAPILLGDGVRLFDNLEPGEVTVEALGPPVPKVTNLRYRVVK